MPTPRPIIVASVGATVGTSARCPIRRMIASELTRPSTAEMIGSVIAAALPNANSRMITAAVRPIDLAAVGLRLGDCLADVAADRDLEPARPWPGPPRR